MEVRETGYVKEAGRWKWEEMEHQKETVYRAD
jgi:hypothetical protein